MREIRRAVGRFTLLTAAVALLVLLLLFFQAVAGALTLGLTGAFESITAEVLVYDQRARLNPQASVLETSTVEAVSAVDGVQVTAPIGIGVFTARVEDSGGSAGEDVDITLFGGDLPGPVAPSTLSQGRVPAGPGEAIFSGSSLDSAFVLDDRLTLGSQTITVVGVADDAAFNVAPTFYVPFETYAAAIRDRVQSPIEVPLSLVGVSLADGHSAAEVAAAITTGVEGVEAVDRATAAAELPGAGQVTQSFSILYLLLFVVVTIVTGVFFLILTVQKTDALVLLRAVGADRGDVVRPVLLQVLAVVGMGAAFGTAAAGGLLTLAQETFGAGLSLTTTIGTVTVILVLGLLASLGAVRRVLDIQPIEATTKAGI